jgi:hypothetical protein
MDKESTWLVECSRQHVQIVLERPKAKGTAYMWQHVYGTADSGYGNNPKDWWKHQMDNQQPSIPCG